MTPRKGMGEGTSKDLGTRATPSISDGGSSQSPFELLTPREASVLGMLMNGSTVANIARTSYVSQATVRTQIRSILTKLDVRSQVQAVALAGRMGWVPPDDELTSQVTKTRTRAT